MADSPKHIRIRGAREHNLNSVDVEIPRDRLVVITGVSGSGKSSLAFDTIFAEGQRKYMESLSAYARQFLTQMSKPDVESIEGLPPTIAIQQRSGGHNPRSTVSTTTEIHDYLRLLMARCGTPTCWAPVGRGTCGRPIESTSASQIVDRLATFEKGSKLILCAPVVQGRKGYHRETIVNLQKDGFVRARVDGEIIDIRTALAEGGENPLNLGRYVRHDIEAVIDRVTVKSGIRPRLADSVETALRIGEGRLLVLDGDAEHRFSDRMSCPDHPQCNLDELEPRLFSFNSPAGACRTCDGLGTIDEFNIALVIPDESMPVSTKAIPAMVGRGRRMNAWNTRQLRKFCEGMAVPSGRKIAQLDEEQRRVLLHGTDGPKKRGTFHFEGILPMLERRLKQTESDSMRERLRAYMSTTVCPACRGARLRPASLAVMLPTIEGPQSIADLSALTIGRAAAILQDPPLDDSRRVIAEPILREIRSRLGFMESVGLGYLSLDRAANTLSGGEAQRIRLATQVGSGLVGVCYVLDEPTIGLHQRDNDRLVSTLRNLADIGNTVVVVEHDEGMIRSADHVLDIGPGPGVHGGNVVSQGTVDDLLADPNSLTGRYLSGERSIEPTSGKRTFDPKVAISVRGAAANNLQGIDAVFPLGAMTCVTGVSGSGKSTLMNQVLLRGAMQQLHGSRDIPGEHDRIEGLDAVDRVVAVDQSPIGRTPRSNPATYTGIFDGIRKLFAATREAKIRAYEPGRFSFNVKGGRCEACQGDGVIKIEMHFLPDVYVTCDVCQGKRYNRETLEVEFKGKSIADVLDMTVEEGARFFQAVPAVRDKLETLARVGLGYVKVGQQATTLSGGEAQRVKLAKELSKRATGRTLYILDEPTTGLHFHDVAKLLEVLHELVEQGNSVLVIEHNLEVIKTADWILDLGPEGGDGGGTLVAAGPPEAIVEVEESYTGRFLKEVLERRPVRRRRTVTAAE
ncbi:MAG TPA: excinuclease ABC subunit A [Phycisphaerales bacterium]|nr:excinuclease ABC subunit A [Phycisphaerales bacterium]